MPINQHDWRFQNQNSIGVTYKCKTCSAIAIFSICEKEILENVLSWYDRNLPCSYLLEANRNHERNPSKYISEPQDPLAPKLN